ncbi:hypothetical protein [aff. Roholtiella sp. LEGE 12411]|nr:hypothetical protein [aff. Roholtiella sp. LEGE 12411]
MSTICWSRGIGHWALGIGHLIAASCFSLFPIHRAPLPIFNSL